MTPTALLRLRAKQCIYIGLRCVYRFDRWHYRIVRENCGYFATVRGAHQRIAPDVTVEVGCGLGEIISALDSRVRVGIDRDVAVLRAARLLRGRSIDFFGDRGFSPVASTIATGDRVCLLMLNWLHAYDEGQALALMADHIRLTSASVVLFDVIHENTAGYRHKHKPESFSALGRIVSIEDGSDSIRSIVTLQVNGRARA